MLLVSVLGVRSSHPRLDWKTIMQRMLGLAFRLWSRHDGRTVRTHSKATRRNTVGKVATDWWCVLWDDQWLPHRMARTLSDVWSTIVKATTCHVSILEQTAEQQNNRITKYNPKGEVERGEEWRFICCRSWWVHFCCLETNGKARCSKWIPPSQGSNLLFEHSN